MLLPVDPFRARFEDLHARGLVSAAEVAYRCAWIKAGRADTERVHRCLGLGARGVQHVQAPTAERLAAALHLEPNECGL